LAWGSAIQIDGNIYINELARALEQSAAPGLTLLESEVKCLLFADDLVLLSPTKEGTAAPRSSAQIHTWALTLNLIKTKLMVFQKGPVAKTTNTHSI
jgi:hypothetical protein